MSILLVIESYDKPLVGTLWYLSALLIVFPLFSWLMQVRNRYWIMIFSFLYSLLYYGAAGVYGNRDYPHDLLRVMAGLCMGAFVYEVIYAFGDYLKRINKALLTIIEVITFLIPILLTYKNVISFRFILVCYIVCCAIMLPKLSYTNKIKGKVFIYLGQLSMPIFVIHWLVGEVVNHYMINNSITLYYGGGNSTYNIFVFRKSLEMVSESNYTINYIRRLRIVLLFRWYSETVVLCC